MREASNPTCERSLKPLPQQHVFTAGPSISGKRIRDSSPGHAGKEGPHLAMTGAYGGFSRAAALYFCVVYCDLSIFISNFIDLIFLPLFLDESD